MKMVRLKMNSCDEVNHHDTRYPVSNSGRHLGEGEVLVPEHVAVVLLATSAGAVRLPDDPEPEPVQCPKCGHSFKARAVKTDTHYI